MLLSLLFVLGAASSAATTSGVQRRTLLQSSPPAAPDRDRNKAPKDATLCEDRRVNAATFNFAVGDYPAKLIQDSIRDIAPDESSQFILQDPSIVQRAFEARFVDVQQDPIVFINIPYLDTGTDRILFDVGNGRFAGGLVTAELAANGIEPASITKIMLTHGHFDHIGGLFNGANATDPAFPNADIYISRTEWEYWLGDDLDTFTSKAPQAALDELEAFAKLYFSQIEDKVKLFEVDTEVLPGIECIHTPWHTPGHCAYLVKNGNDSLLVTGDAIVNIVIGVENPWFQHIADLMVDKGPAGRYALLDRAVAGGWLVNVMHGTFPALGYVTEDGGTRFRFHERRWSVTPSAVAMCSEPGP